MGFHENPEETTSYQSWRDLTGCCCVLVQSRTGDGLKKNTTLFHKMAYSTADLLPFRIIVCDPPDTRINFTENGPGTTNHEKDEPLKNAKKWVVATAATEQEVLFLWDLMRRQFRLPYCGSVAAAAREDVAIPKRDPVRERRLAAAILPSWPSFFKAASAAVAARKRSNGGGGDVDLSSPASPGTFASSSAAASSKPASPVTDKPIQQQQQQQEAKPEAASSSPAAPRQQQQQQQKSSSSPAAASSTPAKHIVAKSINTNTNNSTNAAAFQQQVGSPTTQRNRAFANSFGLEERATRDIVIKELPGIERSIAAACLKLQPSSLSGVVYLGVLTAFYYYARMAMISALLDVAVFSLFLWHCRVPFGSDEYGNSVEKGSSSNSHSVEEALQREREIDALGGLRRLFDVFSLQYPPVAVTLWILAHFLSAHFYPAIFPDGIWPFVSALMLPCTVASLVLAPHIGPVLRPAPPEAFEVDDDENNDAFADFSHGSLASVAGGGGSSPGVFSSYAAGAPSGGTSPNARSPGGHGTPTAAAAGTPSERGVLNNSSITGGAQPMPATVKRCLQLWKQGGAWKLAKERDGVLYRTKPVPWCKPLGIWLTTTIPLCRATDVEAVLCDDSDGSNKSSFAYKFDRMLDKRFKVKELQADPWFEHIWRTCFKTPVFTVKPRELVTKVSPIYYLSPEQQARWDIKSDTGVVYTFTGTSDDTGSCPLDANYERGQMYCYGMFAVESGGGVILHQILSMDLGGMLPSWLVNLTNDEQIDRVACIRDLTFKHKGSLPLQGGPARPDAALSDATRALIQPDPEAEAREAQQKLEEQQRAAAAAGALPPKPEHPLFAGAMPRALQKALRLINSNEWAVVKTEDDIQYSTAPSPFCGKVAVKLHTMLPRHIRAADVKAQMDDDPKAEKGRDCSAFKFDRLLDQRILIKYISDNLQHWRTCYKSPVWGVKARDMCTVYNSFFVDPAVASKQWKVPQAFLAGPSAEAPVPEMFVISAEDNGTVIPADSNFTRGAVHVYTILAVDTPRGVDYTTILSIDPQGYIPGSLVDATNVEQIEKMKIQRDLFSEEAVRRKKRETAAAAPSSSSGAAAAAAATSSSSTATAGAAAAAAGELKRRHPTLAAIPGTLQRAIKMYREAEWKEVKSQEGVVFRDAPSPFCGKRACVFETMLPAGSNGVSAEDVAATINDDTTGGDPNANAYTYDRLLTKRVLVKKSDDELQWTWRTMYKSPMWGVQARDFVMLTEFGYLSAEQQRQIGFEATPVVEAADGTKSPGEVWVFSCEDRGTDVPADSNFTRGALHAYAIVAVETGRGVRLVQIMSMDPCGYIPASVIDMTNAEQIAKLVIMRRLMEQHAQKRKKLLQK